jgi:hypothetical protein
VFLYMTPGFKVPALRRRLMSRSDVRPEPKTNACGGTQAVGAELSQTRAKPAAASRLFENNSHLR